MGIVSGDVAPSPLVEDVGSDAFGGILVITPNLYGPIRNQQRVEGSSELRSVAGLREASEFE